MADALSEVISLLQPSAVYSKPIAAAGRWAVRYSEFGHPSFCVVLAGQCLLATDGCATVTLETGDFVLLPATPAFTLSGFDAVEPEPLDPKVMAKFAGDIRYGDRKRKPEVTLLGGYFVFDTPNARLLPALIHVRAAERLTTLVRLIAEETRERRPGSELVLNRLVEVLLAEALRSTPQQGSPPGLLRGLADARLARTIRLIHGEPALAWTVQSLAKAAALSRSAFFLRFTQAVGMPPMQYLLAWRMAIAKDLLRREDLGIAEIAGRVGYGSASAFSTAFKHQVGAPPSEYARALTSGPPRAA